MATDFPFVEVPPELAPILGERDGDSRVYRREGSTEESGAWFDALSEVMGFVVSPGGAGMYCPVSRAAVYKRIKEGKLSLFLFHVTHRKTNLFGRTKVVRESPYGYVVVSELKAWLKELEERAVSQNLVTVDELEGSKPDWIGDFLEWRSKWRKQQQKNGGKDE